METQLHPSSPPIDLPAQAYRHLVHTLITLLPPPPDSTPESLQTRNHAAIARVAALAPVNAAEAELAAQCIAARAQAEDVMRLIRVHAGDIRLVLRLNAQYAAMVRASLAALSHLRREQQQRQKREVTHNTADADESLRQTAANTMLEALTAAPKAQAPAQSASNSDQKSHLPRNETPERRRYPEPATVASVNALIDAALRAANVSPAMVTRKPAAALPDLHTLVMAAKTQPLARLAR
ncbi:MAG TPA: hypothetical protein DDZ81_20245 [Acetobacteraceae bacterium]|jgi:hypothetical protein|nr:hypothetical protein [Acetobacteraceae bacterium]